MGEDGSSAHLPGPQFPVSRQGVQMIDQAGGADPGEDAEEWMIRADITPLPTRRWEPC